MKPITIVGLGYVGLPLACLCARKGHQVFGLEIDTKKIEKINAGISPIHDSRLQKSLAAAKKNLTATSNPRQCIPQSDTVIVCVPTPVHKNHTPDLAPLINATEFVAPLLNKGTLFVIESTIHPGTVEEIIVPILEKHGLFPFKNDLFVAHCPERIDPGSTQWTVENLPRVVGGITPQATLHAQQFYQGIISAPVLCLSSVKAAEATKIMENTFRDINIAFINEMAQSFDKAGIDILEVIKGASTKPFAFMPHYPGAGVGGHCIPVDPYYLIEKAKKIGFHHRFLSLAREINNSMPAYTVGLLEAQLQKRGITLAGAKVGVLGLAYKKDVDDTRESPAYTIIEILKEKGAEIFVYDPFVHDAAAAITLLPTLDLVLQKIDYIILATDHTEFKAMDAAKLKANHIAVVIDGRNCLDKEKITALGIAYHGIGRK